MSTWDIILWDLDGTLTDPKLGITKSVQYALAHLGIKETNLEKLTAFIGPPLIESFSRFYDMDSTTAQRAVELYREYFAKSGIFENQLIDGIPDLLNDLSRSKKTMYVATSKPTVFATQIVQHFGIAGYFRSVMGSNLDHTRTDKSEVIEYVLSFLHQHPPKDIVMIGDRKHDVLGARQNGIDSIAVEFGYGSHEELVVANPTFIANSVADLARILA